jgi:hypothetical protein
VEAKNVSIHLARWGLDPLLGSVAGGARLAPLGARIRTPVFADRIRNILPLISVFLDFGSSPVIWKITNEKQYFYSIFGLDFQFF